MAILASCQNESIEDRETQQAELKFKDGNVISDGLLEDDELMFNEKSEQLVKPNSLFAEKSLNNCTPDIYGLVSMLPC